MGGQATARRGIAVEDGATAEVIEAPLLPPRRARRASTTSAPKGVTERRSGARERLSAARSLAASGDREFRTEPVICATRTAERLAAARPPGR